MTANGVLQTIHHGNMTHYYHISQAQLEIEDIIQWRKRVQKIVVHLYIYDMLQCPQEPVMNILNEIV